MKQLWKLFAAFAAVAMTAVLAGCDKNDDGGKGDGGEWVPERTISLRVSDILTNIDADTPEAVEADLAAGTLWVKGGGMNLASDGLPLQNGDRVFDCTLVDADNVDVATAILTMKNEKAEIRTAYSFLPIDNQIYYDRKWVFAHEGGNEQLFDVFVVRSNFTRASVVPAGTWHFRLYEDLTEHYRTKFPDAGVRSVARVLISQGSK